MEEIKVYINGKEVITSAGKTILEAVHENKIDKIPTLCHDKRIEPFTSCYLCVVEVEGQNKLIPSCSTKVSNGMKIKTDSTTIRNSRKTALELLFSNHYADCIGPCKESCPAGVDAQTYIALSSMGKYKEALKLVKENNPLPLSIGRVCVRDCENACRRNLVDEPVACNYLKRFIADQDKFEMWTPDVKPPKNKKVAIIGGGPAGLTCAYYLALEGYRSTIFEKLPHLGGMLRYGIPEYRLPKNVLDEEINWILSLGAEAKTGVVFGKDTSVKNLLDEGYDAIFIGVGAHKAATMGLEGENEIEGIYRGIDFLREVEMGTAPKLHGTVAVIGGGNTAIDAARTALRYGAEKVKIIYRRSIKEMPAHHEEIEAAEKEGVEILFLTNPKSIVSENKKLKGFECLQMKLESSKPGERPQPVPVPGSEFIVECDFAIGAIGQKVDSNFLTIDKNVNVEKWGTVKVNPKSLETTIPGVFAGGDVVTGPLTAISSIAQGKQAANAIMGYLEKGAPSLIYKPFLSFRHRFGNLSENEFAHLPKIEREKNNEIDIADRVCSFDEVETGITEEQLHAECDRCLECGCSEFYDCAFRKYAEEYDIDINNLIGDVKKYTIDNRHPLISLDANKCINCGRCVRTCSEILEVSALGFVYRGFRSVVKPAMEKALLETNCIACGNCIDTCPTGAIAEKFQFKILGTLPKEDVETVCSFCSVGCKVNFKKVSDDIFWVSNSTEEIMDTHNRGYLCVKGRFGHRYLMEKNRILGASIKNESGRKFTEINDALNVTEKRIKEIIKTYGPESVAVFASPKLSNEELYLLQKFARAGLGNNNISSFSDLFKDKELFSLDKLYGAPLSSVQTDDLKNADIIAVMNCNLTEDNFVMELKIKEAVKKGARLVVFDSAETPLTRYADLWIDSRKGTNTPLLNAMMKSINNDSTTEFGKYLSDINESEAVSESGIGEEKFTLLKDIFSNNDLNIVFVYNPDSFRDKSAGDLNAISNFLLVTGRESRKNNGIILIKDHINSTGMLDMGATPSRLPGYVKFSDKENVKRISDAWNNADLASIKDHPKLEQLLTDKKIKAALVFGEDILSGEKVKELLSGLEFLMVCDSFNTAAAEYADVVFPAPTHIEYEGTFTNCDHTVQKSEIVTSNYSFPLSWKLISNLASRFSNALYYDSEEEILTEIKAVNRLYNEMEVGKSVFRSLITSSSIPELYSPKDEPKYSAHSIPAAYQDNYFKNRIKAQLI